MLKKILFILLIIVMHSNCSYASQNKQLFEFIEKGDLVSVKELLKKGADVNCHDEKGISPLHHACYLGQFEIVKVLVSNGANVHEKISKLQVTPLHGATMNGNLKLVAFLIEHGADINVKDSENGTPLLAACWIGAFDTVKYLVSKGAELHFKNNLGVTPLHTACQSGNLDLVEFLINNNCEINAQAANGTTPLHIAVALGNFPIVRKLISCGADRELKMKYNARLCFCLKAPILTENDIMYIDLYKGQTALDIAIDKKQKEIIKLIKNVKN